jgi:hypothetical protein
MNYKTDLRAYYIILWLHDLQDNDTHPYDILDNGLNDIFSRICFTLMLIFTMVSVVMPNAIGLNVVVVSVMAPI